MAKHWKQRKSGICVFTDGELSYQLLRKFLISSHLFFNYLPHFRILLIFLSFIYSLLIVPMLDLSLNGVRVWPTANSKGNANSILFQFSPAIGG